MATRVSIAFVVVTAAALVSPAQSRTITLRSERRDMSVAVTTPPGWALLAYRAWPSYDTFTFRDDHRPTACMLEVRFDQYSDQVGDRHSPEDIAIHWNSTPIEAIRAQLRRDYSHPRVQHIATVSAAGDRIRVYAVYHAPDYDYYAADIRRGDTVVALTLYSERDRDFDRHRAEFLWFVRSLRIM